MFWKYPACQTAIQHHEPEARVGVVYRCNVCRLELVKEITTGQLALAPYQTSRRHRCAVKNSRHDPCFASASRLGDRMYTERELTESANRIVATRKLPFRLETVRIEQDAGVARFYFWRNSSSRLVSFDCAIDVTKAELEGAIAVQLESST
jgi:hypothetical protein